MNKSSITNLVALAIAIIAYHFQQSLLFTVAVFALSGALTNWIAVHMLFEKVPGLYGSGVVPAHFQEFKTGIRNLMMQQFFNSENFERFIDREASKSHQLGSVIKKLNLEPAFDSLVKTIMESSFGGMLSMMGGEPALQPLKQPFIDNMRESIVGIAESDEFATLLAEELEQPDTLAGIRDNIEIIIDSRLEELTPQIVKTIIQDMIRKHLGWLVVWGGLFGALIGLISSLSGLL